MGMGRLQTKAVDNDYIECDRRLTEQFIHRLDDKGMISEILREVSMLEDIDDTTSEWILLVAQRVQKEVLDNI